VNLATGRLTSVRSFAETAAQVLSVPPERLEFGAIPTRAEEMEHAEVTVERLRRMIGWVPSTAIEDGIRRTLDHWQATT
jgi:nucleoside-diphosphate-sugar epimerase